MSGKTKRILYHAADAVLFLAALAGAVLMFLAAAKQEAGLGEYIAAGALIVAFTLRIPVFLHEAGHALFGLLAGMKLVSVRVSLLFWKGETAGRTLGFPKRGRGAKGKLICFVSGGSVLNFIAGGALLALYLALPYHAGLLFAGMFSLFSLYEGIRALIPAEFSAGKTDGKLLLGLLRGDAEEDVLLRVFTAEGYLYRGEFSDLPRELLFGAPVVREDLEAYHALLLFRAQYLLAEGERTEAERELDRLLSLGEYLTEETRREAERYKGFFRGTFEPEDALLGGVAALEEALGEKENPCSQSRDDDIIQEIPHTEG